MSSGHYPLNAEYSPMGKELARIAADLKNVLDNTGMYSIYPAAYDNENAEDGASDGHYEARLFLALEFIEYCLEKNNE